ncbi:MAG: ABC transporter ATP-binding protein [Candidatus Thorarchaeota archaeon]
MKSINLEVKAGESIGYLGPNGAGKTTTIQILLNLLRPSNGDVYIFGEQMQGQERKILRRIGALVELPGFYDYLSPDHILYHICKVYRMNKTLTKQRIRETLKLVRLSEVQHRPVGTFSTGMRRRLGIAQVLVHDPELLIFDEPTNGLDPKGVREMRDLIKSLNADGKTVFMSSHNLPEVTEISERVLFLRKGEIIEDTRIMDLKDRLSSNQIEIKFVRDLNDEECKALASVKGITNVYGEYNRFLEYDGNPESTHLILKEIMNSGLPLNAFMPRAITLEELYLHLFGSEVA